MTGLQLAVKQIISGVGFLPESDQQGLFQTMRFLESVFGQKASRTPDEQEGIALIEQGFMNLFKHLLTGIVGKDGMQRKIALIWQAAEQLHPEFIAKFRRSETTSQVPR